MHLHVRTYVCMYTYVYMYTCKYVPADRVYWLKSFFIHSAYKSLNLSGVGLERMFAHMYVYAIIYVCTDVRMCVYNTSQEILGPN